MIFTLTTDGYLLFNCTVQDPHDWIEMVRTAFPSAYVACYGGFDNAIYLG